MKKRWYECSAETPDYANEIYCVCAETRGKAKDIASYKLDVPFTDIRTRIITTDFMCFPDGDYTQPFYLDSVPPVVDNADINFDWFEYFMQYGHFEKDED